MNHSPMEETALSTEIERRETDRLVGRVQGREVEEEGGKGAESVGGSEGKGE